MENIRGNYDTFAATLAITEEEAYFFIYNEIRVELLRPLRADSIFADMSRESDKNFSTLANKGREMDCIAVSNKTVTTTADSNALVKNWYQSECLNNPPR